MAPQACLPGEYQDETGQATCKPCPAGSYCDTRYTMNPMECPPGTYCPEGTKNPLVCPAGTYAGQESLTALSDCIPCPPGKYCALRGASAPTGPCAAVRTAANTREGPGDVRARRPEKTRGCLCSLSVCLSTITSVVISDGSNVSTPLTLVSTESVRRSRGQRS